MKDLIERITRTLGELTREDFINFFRVEENVRGVLIRVCSTLATIQIVGRLMTHAGFPSQVAIPVTILAALVTYFIARNITMKK
jgi:hypothetical protein